MIVLDIIAIVVSIVSFCFSIYCFHSNKKISKKSNEIAQKQEQTAEGNFELQIRNSISAATKNVIELALKLNPSDNDTILKCAYYSAEEIYRNAYEDACAKYIDGKVDKVRFKKSYSEEIKNLVENEQHKSYYSDNQSPYSSTLAVYKEWFRQA